LVETQCSKIRSEAFCGGPLVLRAISQSSVLASGPCHRPIPGTRPGPAAKAHGAGQFAIQQRFHVFAGGAALAQNPDGNFSWIFAVTT
jgi:hypothetical protein